MTESEHAERMNEAQTCYQRERARLLASISQLTLEVEGLRVIREMLTGQLEAALSRENTTNRLK